MDSGLIILADDTQVPVQFRLGRDGQSGTLSVKHARDFSTVMRIFSQDEIVILQKVRGTWKAHVQIWEPDRHDDSRLAAFRFTVQEQIES
jgi:hypothetical protein